MSKIPKYRWKSIFILDVWLWFLIRGSNFAHENVQNSKISMKKYDFWQIITEDLKVILLFCRRREYLASKQLFAYVLKASRSVTFLTSIFFFLQMAYELLSQSRKLNNREVVWIADTWSKLKPKTKIQEKKKNQKIIHFWIFILVSSLPQNSLDFLPLRTLKIISYMFKYLAFCFRNPKKWFLLC